MSSLPLYMSTRLRSILAIVHAPLHISHRHFAGFDRSTVHLQPLLKQLSHASQTGWNSPYRGPAERVCSYDQHSSCTPKPRTTYCCTGLSKRILSEDRTHEKSTAHQRERPVDTGDCESTHLLSNHLSTLEPSLTRWVHGH